MAKTSTLFGAPRVFSEQMPAVGGGGSIPTIQFSTGNARALQDFSRSLFSLSSQFEDQLDQQAEAEAAKEGALAGLAGDVEERSYQTLRGRAYNKAMLETFVTSIDTQSMIKLTQLQQQHWGDPVALEKASNEYIAGVAQEVDRIAPGSGAAYRQRQTARLLSSVEQERDTRYKLTQDEANARLIQHEALMMQNLKRTAGDLFSDNPARSAAASSAMFQSVNEYLATYDAVDPVTGKPLFTKADKEKARLYIKDEVLTKATVGWFEQQPDPVAAYMKLQDPDFSFNVKLPGERLGRVVHENQGKTRNLPVSKEVEQKLSVVAGSMGDGVTVHITSGGQPSRADIARGHVAGRRTGSNRHDHGNAADIQLSVNGRRVTPQQDPELYKQFAENAAAAGFTGIGHYSWGLHVGGGSVAAWGPDTTSNTLDPDFGRAIARGRARAGQGMLSPVEHKTSLREALSDRAFASLDSELRQRINFANAQADRAQRAEDEAFKAEQDAASVEVTARIYSAGQIDPETGDPVLPVTAMDILDMQRERLLTPEQARAFIKALETERPEKSDRQTYLTLLTRIEEGEDVADDVIAYGNAGQLSTEDVKMLLDRSRQRIESVGRLSPSALRARERLQGLLEPNPMMGGIDFEDRKLRQTEALAEFDRRALAASETGESLDDVAREIGDRAKTQTFAISLDALDKLVLPRFSISAQGPSARWIDIGATAKSLMDARAQGKITEREYQEQAENLKQWHAIQEEVLKAEPASRAKGKGK